MPYEGRCGYCDRRRKLCYRISRFGGGSYKRAGRWYSGTICGECATELIEKFYRPGAYESISRYSHITLKRIAERYPLDLQRFEAEEKAEHGR